MGGASGAARPSLRRPSLFAATWWASVLGGWAVVVLSVAGLTGPGLADMGAPLVMLAALVIVGELRPVVPNWAGSIPVPFSTAFVFAALYLWGLGPAAALMALGTITSELAARKPPWKLLFNVGQYVLSVTAAALVMAAAGVLPASSQRAPVLDGGDVGWLLLTWVAYHLVNITLVAGLAESDGMTFVESFTEDFWFYTFSTMAVLALSPMVAIVAAASPSSWVLLPLLVLPLIAVYATARLSRDREHASLHDALTDLPNRNLLARRTADALVDARRSGRGIALFLLDLDHFKEVNDTLGHSAGDLLLRVVGQRVCDAVRPSDTVARLGGDEFAVLLPDVDTEQDAIDVAHRILAVLRDPVPVQGVPVEVGVSIGIVRVDPRGAEHGTADSFEALLRRADVAMYLAKGERTGISVYEASRDPHSPERLGAAADLRAALMSGALSVFFQPQVALGDDRVVGVEALARWDHPVRGAVPPGEFVPLAERTGLIHRLTETVLDLSLAQVARWRAEGLDVPVAVNVSIRDLQDTDMVATVTSALERHGLPAGVLVLEVTESAFVKDMSRAVAAVRRLRDHGVRSSLDDFGTGFSTLVHLQQVPVAEVKIDRSFVAAMDQGGDDGLVRAVVGLAHGLGLRVVAEGVESQDSLDRLAGLGCDVAQGYAVARPMPAEEAGAWLARRLSPGPVLRAVADPEARTG